MADDPRSTDERIERALYELGRVEPAPDLSARILTTLPPQARRARVPAPAWLGAATLLAAMLGFALAYRTAFILRANGAFDLVAYYTAQPEIVTLYPNEAWNALAAAIPWATVVTAALMLTLALALTYRWTGRAARVVG